MKKSLLMQQELSSSNTICNKEEFLQFVKLIIEKYKEVLPFEAILEFTHESELRRYEDVVLLKEDGEKFNGMLLHSAKISYKEYFGAGLLEEVFIECFLLDDGSILVVDTVVETAYNGDRIDKFYYRKLSECQSFNGLSINKSLDCLFKIIKQSLFNLDIRQNASSVRGDVSHVPLSVEENDDVPF
ncbi:hypothetical protein D7X33_26050 [Butyricicoccus sp. 1XD8-22]|nr:hypothetical protein D7X33_26050 [Butyricicoccus sp. 1XD8-22]